MELEQRGDLLLSLFSRGDVPSEFVEHELAELVWGPDLDRFARGVVDVVIAEPGGRAANMLWLNIAVKAGSEEGGLSRATATAVLRRLEAMERAPDTPRELRETAAMFAPGIRARIR